MKPDKKLFRCLTIAGSDSGGGAGIQTDLKTFSTLGVYGMSAITALTAQNTMEVRSIYPIPSRVIFDQIHACLEDIGADCIKIGMLGTSKIIETVYDCLKTHSPIPIVLDPVMVAKSGDSLLKRDAMDSLLKRLIPLSSILTPNLPEAEALTQLRLTHPSAIQNAAQILLKTGCETILIKGGHANTPIVHDYFAHRDGTSCWLESPRIITPNTHGTGCTLSSAIAAFLAQGQSHLEAIKNARAFLVRALDSGSRYRVGKGHGPVLIRPDA